MTPEHIRLLYSYNTWANRRSLDACAAASKEELTRDLRSSFPSLRDTLAHILGGEWIWLERWYGRSHKALPEPSLYPDLASLRAKFNEQDHGLEEFARGVLPGDLSQVLEYRNVQGNKYAYPLASMLQHLVNHGTYHRGQVTTLLRQIGKAPAATDFIAYLREGAQPPAMPPTVETIGVLFDYNAWANHRMLDACEALAPEAFTRDLGSSFRSVRDTLVHILAVEWLWLERWRGRSPTNADALGEFPDLASVRRGWKPIERDLRQAVRALTREESVRRIEYHNTRGLPFANPVWEVLLHLANHSTYHRGQVTTLLRQLGARPQGTDFLRYFDVLAAQPEE